jgi:predicted GIY-YIG superfamily endonuclease
MFYTYVLKNKKGEWYIGYCTDIDQRIKQHKVQKPEYTLVYYEAYLTDSLARNRERMLKEYGGAWRAVQKRLEN